MAERVIRFREASADRKEGWFSDGENFGDTPACKGYWIKAVVEPGGRFTITNARNGFTKAYTAR